jgi:hypothetical protein
MPVAGRSLRAPPSARSVLTRFAILAALASKRRLSGTGSPSLAVPAAEWTWPQVFNLRCIPVLGDPWTG